MVTAASIEAGGAFIKVWADDAQAQAALSKLQGRVRRFADEVASIGRGMALSGAAMAVPVAKAVKQYAAFADKMSAVNAIVEANRVQVARLNQTAKQMAGSFTPTEIAEGMLELGRAGFNTREIIESIPGSLDLARAGAMRLGEATDILANTLRSFGMDTDLTDQVADILAMTANISTTDVHGIGDAMKHVASSAKLSGQSIERVSAALAVMANRGLKGELAGTALARTLVKLAETETREMLKLEFGVEVSDAKGNLRDVLDIFRDLGAATRGFGNQEKLELFKDMFDMRGMKGAINLAEHIEEWDRITENLKNSAGTAERVAQQMDDNLGGSFRDIAAKAQLLQIALGEALSEPMRAWGRTLVAVLQSTGAFIDRNQEFVVGMVKMGAIFTATGMALYIFGKGAKGLTGVIGIFKRLSEGLKGFHDRATGMTAANKALEDAKESLEKTGKNHIALLERETKAAEKLTTAQEKAAKADAKLAERKRELAEAQQAYDAALQKTAMQRQKVAAAEVGVDEATKNAALRRTDTSGAPLPLDEQARKTLKDNRQAREDYEAATRALATAERDLAGARATGAEAKGRSERADAAVKAAAQEELYRKERLAQAELAHTEAAQREALKRQRIVELEAQAKAAAQKAVELRAIHAGVQAQLAVHPDNKSLQGMERSAAKDVARQDEVAAAARNRLALETAQLAKLEAASADAADRVTNARIKANAAIGESASRQQIAKTRQEEARAAEDKLAQAIDQRAERQRRARAAEAQAVTATRAAYGAQEKQSGAAQGDADAKQARAALTAETRALHAAEEELARTGAKVRNVQTAVEKRGGRRGGRKVRHPL